MKTLLITICLVFTACGANPKTKVDPYASISCNDLPKYLMIIERRDLSQYVSGSYPRCDAELIARRDLLN